jgi:hypothetical protein
MRAREGGGSVFWVRLKAVESARSDERESVA